MATRGDERSGGPSAEKLTHAWVRLSDLAAVRRKVAALSKRCERLGTGPIELRELERRDGECRVELRGQPPRVAGWEVVGRLEHLGGGAGRLSPGSSVADRLAWEGEEPWCEHCGLLRRRTVTYLVRRGRGEVRQIGSSCLRDFTGHDLGRALRQVELAGEAGAVIRRASATGNRDERRPPLEAFLALVFAVVRECQGGEFVPRSKGSEGAATADLASAAWEAGERADASDVERARDLIEWGRRHLRRLRRPSSYERRLLELLERGGRLTRSEPVIVAGLCAVRTRWEERSYLGAVGERVEAELEVRAVRSAGRNRFGEVVWHGMRDRQGRWVTWFASGGRQLEEGRCYRVRGSVRRHGEWRGRPVTVLLGCVAEASEPKTS